MNISERRSSAAPVADHAARLARRSSCSGAAAYTQLPVAPLPAGGLPHHLGQRQPPRRQPGDDGLGGGHAARAALRAHRRAHRDDLHELARVDLASPCSSTSIATSTPPRATCRRRSTPRRRRPADQPALPAQLPQGEPGRRADPDPRAHLGDAAARRRSSTPRTRCSRRRSRRWRASARCSSAAGSSRRCGCRSIRRRSPGVGLTLEDVRTVLARRDGRTGRRAALGGELAGHARIATNDQLFRADEYRTLILA